MENSNVNNGDINVKELLRKYAEGTASEREQDLFEQWYINLNRADHEVPDEDELTTTEKIMLADLMGKIKPARRVSLWPRITVAAAAVAAITLGTWLYYTSSISGSSSRGIEGSLVYATDIAPGRNTATLTLASGEVINLDTNRTSVIVADSVKTMTMLTASTPRGGTYQITLPDGTDVWLNADSKISFPSQFTKAKRRITLEGEAYFQVAKDKSHPFVVESKGQQVEVLGTHFNINAYSDEGSAKTTLLEGSVRVSYAPRLRSTSSRGTTLSSRGTAKDLGPTGPGTILKPNQQSVLTDNDRIQVRPANTEETIAWKNGYFRFNDENITSIMAKLSRWYNIEVKFEATPTLEGFNGKISRYKNISQVLKMLEETNAVRFKVQGNTVTVLNKS